MVDLNFFSQNNRIEFDSEQSSQQRENIFPLTNVLEWYEDQMCNYAISVIRAGFGKLAAITEYDSPEVFDKWPVRISFRDGRI